MNDLISRRAAIKAIDDLPNCYNGYSDTYDKAYIIGVLEELPPIEQKRGKWIKIVDCNTVQCSECFDDFDYVDGLCYLCHGQELPNHCPNCGAKMERSEE